MEIYILNSTFYKVCEIFAMENICATTFIINIYRATYMYQYVVNVLSTFQNIFLSIAKFKS